MIKCNVQLCGVVAQSANTRTNGEGKAYTFLTLAIALPEKEGEGKTIEVSVIKDGNDADLLKALSGKRIEMTGDLLFRKQGDNTFLNFFPTSYNLSTTETEDFIRGTMEFSGKVGKRVDEKKGKGGKPIVHFSAFSARRLSDDDYEYLWVHFYRYDKARESWLKPQTRITASGALEIGLYNGNISLSCRLGELSPQTKGI